jgi:hypothetical protein
MTRLSTLRLNADEAIGSGGVDVYTTLDSLPSTGLTTGDQAWIESDGRLYISNGSGWYNVALVNATPSLSLDQSGTITMNADTLTVTVVASATDSDDNQDMISFSVESDGNMLATGVTVSQDSSVFTITSLTEDSGGVAGDFTLTFKATDGIAVDNEDLSFTLSFSNVVDSSAETVFLMKAQADVRSSEAHPNFPITFVDSAGTDRSLANTGNSVVGSFSPYRSGGYSVYFYGSDYLQFAADNDWGFGTSAWTIEFWYKSLDQASHDVISAFGTSSPFPGWGVNVATTGRITMFFSDGSGSDGFDTVSGTTAIDDGEWHHVVLTAPASSTTVSCYVDGTLAGSHTFTETASTTGQILRVGADTNTSPARYMEGYLRDVRIVVGSQVYTSAFTPPTEALTAITNTKLLCCHVPYIGEGSEQRTITLVGNPETRVDTPYDYEPWNSTDFTGSVFFDGAGSYLDVQSADGRDTAFDLNGNSFTIRGWIRTDGDASATRTIFSTGGGTASWATSSGAQYQLVLDTNNKLSWSYNNSGNASANVTSMTLPLNMWHYISVSHTDGGSTYMHVNGILGQTVSSPTYTNVTSQNIARVGSTQSSGYETTQNFHGYIADLEFIQGTSVYTSANYTPPTSPTTQHSNSTFLMNNKADASVYDLSSSANIRLTNNTTVSTTQRKFTTAHSVYVDGTDDQMIIYNKPLTGDLTIEGWFYQDIAQDANYRWLFGSSTYAGSAPLAIYTRNAQVQGWANSSSASFVASSFTAQTWHHVAVVRNSGTWKIYLDGTGGGTTTTNGTYDFANTTDWWFGTYTAGSYDFKGYYQDWRISNFARYTADFTPPTAEFEL